MSAQAFIINVAKVWQPQKLSCPSKFLELNYFHMKLKNIRLLSSLQPRLVVSPRVSLMNVKTTIRVEELEPLKPVTLRAEMLDDKGKLFYSSGHYIASKDGVVDTASSESVGGSYKGVFPAGLFSTLKVAKGNFQYTRMHKNDIKEPNKIKILLQNGHNKIEEDHPCMASEQLERYILNTGVKRVQVRDGRVRGVLYIPEGEGPFPGVIDMYGAVGILYENRAALNASRGIASLALAYYNYDDIPADKVLNLDLEYFEEATEYVLSLPFVQPKKCGVIGNCAGGFLGFIMAAYLEKINAVYLINSSINSFVSDVTYKGEVIAHAPDLSASNVRVLEDGSVLPTEEVIQQRSSYVCRAYVDRILKKDDLHFGIAVGGGDPYKFRLGWENLSSVLAAQNFHNISIKHFPKAGHQIHPPYFPFNSTIFSKVWVKGEGAQSQILYFGGEDYWSVLMQEQTWQDMFTFINRHFK